MTSQLPYHNLIITGFIGVNRVTITKVIAKLTGAVTIDLDNELQIREGMSSEEIRSLYGESRLRNLEDGLCRELALHRSAVISVGGQTLLDEGNRARLLNSGQMLILTCALNEILRRLYGAQGARFHDPKVRSASIYQIKRERQVEQITAVPTLDTTTFTVDEVADHAIRFWRTHDFPFATAF